MKKTILIFMVLLASLPMSSFGATKTMDAVSVIHSIIDMKEDTDFVVTGEISNEILSYIANVIKESKYKIGLDLSNTTGLSHLGGFSGCKNLTSITIPSSVITLGSFDLCSNLKNVSILGNITRINSYTFEFCENLSTINLPDSVTWIGENAFKGCKNLASITIPKNVRYIGEEAFHECINLTSVTFPASVRIIGKWAFCECTKLAKVSFSEGLSEIGREAFYYCTNLTSITIPASVTCIEECAFYKAGLTSAIFKNTKWRNAYRVEMDYKLKNPSTAATFLKRPSLNYIHSYNE